MSAAPLPDSVPEATLTDAPGATPETGGWFTVNLRDARWRKNARFGSFCGFEGAERFEQFGINVHVLEPNQPACLYHRENQQEGFLVLRGSCRVIIEGRERALRELDYVHCPPGTNHVFVGGPDGPCAILMVGARLGEERIVYPVDQVAARYGASVTEETPEPRRAYEGTPASEDTDCPL